MSDGQIIDGFFMKPSDTSSARRRRKKIRLFVDQDGRCHYCRIPMLLSFHHMAHQPANLATIEHLDSRLSGERGKHHGEIRIVLACRQCNHERGTQEYNLLSLDERRERSVPRAGRSRLGDLWPTNPTQGE